MPQRRKSAPPPLEIREFSREEIEKGIRKLQRRFEEVETFRKNSVARSDPRVETATSNIRTTILEIFGENSPEFQEHKFHQIWHGSRSMYDAATERQSKFEAGIPHTLSMLEGLIARLEEKREDLLGDSGEEPKAKEAVLESNRNVFVVHGHDELNTLRLEKLLRDRWNLNPIILREKPGIGRTLIEKFEQEAPKAAYAFVFITPDDQVQVSDGLYSQARPNAIFELGWFYGKLGRDRVCILLKQGAHFHSDLDGISRIEFNEDVGEKISEIEKELQVVKLI